MRTITFHEYADQLCRAAEPTAPIVIQSTTYEPHCIIAWEEQMRAVDDHDLKGTALIICAAL